LRPGFGGRFPGEPLGPDVEYLWTVASASENGQDSKPLISDKTTRHDMDLDLPPGQRYVFTLVAYKQGKMMGTCVIHGRRGAKRSYSFRVNR